MATADLGPEERQWYADRSPCAARLRCRRGFADRTGGGRFKGQLSNDGLIAISIADVFVGVRSLIGESKEIPQSPYCYWLVHRKNNFYAHADLPNVSKNNQ